MTCDVEGFKATIATLEARVKVLTEALGDLVSAATMLAETPVLAEAWYLIKAVNKIRVAVPKARAALQENPNDR